ncbi:uncharacterized protein LOC120336006 isoform X2 [Styela clava]
MWFLLIWISLFSLTQSQTPESTSDFRNYRLELFEEGKRYDDARTVCEGRNAWLVEIKDEETQDAVRQLTEVPGRPGTVSDSFNNFCVTSRSSDGKWMNYDCGLGYRYVCQSDRTWINFNNELTLQIITSPVKTFFESQQSCAKNGSTLVEIKTNALEIFINQKLSDSNNFWTSGSDLEEEGSWKWGDGTAIDINDDNWEKWSGGNEPNGGKIENCLIKYASVNYKWVDYDCNQLSGYICQRDVSSGDCGRDVCSGKGTCQLHEDRYKCTCDAGYFGTKCEKDLLTISTSSAKYNIEQGQSLTVKFNITSYDGNINIRVSTNDNSSVTSKSTTAITSNTVLTTLSFTFNPFGVNSKTRIYNFTATPVSAASYSRVATITVVNPDQCDSSPCTSRGNCTYSLESPYYKCTCQSAYTGTSCEKRRFIINTAKNCKYHINLYDKKSFADANSTCKELGGAVAMMKTTEIQALAESQIITQYGATGPTILFWIGGYKVNTSWIWVDGTVVPTTGEDSKWSSWFDNTTKQGEMVLSSHPDRSRNSMRWFATENNAQQGYICEIAAIDRCSPSPCLNSGSCIQIGCQRKCKCMWGYTGENCETRISQISCFQSGISILWNQEKHKFESVYKLYLEDLMSKTSKVTNVQILLTNEPTINIGNVSEPSPIHCFSSTRLSISPNKYILVDLWVARIRMSLKSVAKVYHIFDESKLNLEFVDLT